MQNIVAGPTKKCKKKRRTRKGRKSALIVKINKPGPMLSRDGGLQTLDLLVPSKKKNKINK